MSPGDMTGLVRPAEEEEAVGLQWEGVGAAGVENRQSSSPVESVPARITRRKNKKGRQREDKRKTYCSAQA